MNTLFSKKLISALIAVLIILSSFTIAFADSDEPAAGSEVSSDPAPVEVTSYADEVGEDESSSASDVYFYYPVSKLEGVPSNEAIDMDNSLREVAYNYAISQATSEGGTRAVDYAQLIYNILYDVWGGNGSSVYYLWVKDYALNNQVQLIRGYIDDVEDRLSEISDYTSEITAVGGVSDRLYDIYTFLIEMLQNTSDEGYLETIKNALAVIQTSNLNPMKNSLSSIDSKIGTTNTGLTAIDSSIGSLNTLVSQFKSANHTDITSLQNDLNNILWEDLNVTLSRYNVNNEPLNSGNSLFVKYKADNNLSPSREVPYIYKFVIPSYPLNNHSVSEYSIKFYGYNNNLLPDVKFIWLNEWNTSTIYAINIPNHQPFSFTITGHLYQVGNSGVHYQSVGNIYAIPLDSPDAQLISQYILQNHIDNDLHSLSGGIDKLVQMYASDDELTAKQAQQQYEQDSLTDFTGGGTAAASGTDRNGLKSVSNTAKSGFDSGGSISDGLSVFNSNNSIWGWFSQDNASYFTTNRSLMKSNNNSELITEIPDYLSTSDKYMNDNLGDNYDQSNSK